MRDVGELFGVTAVARLLPPQLQEDGDGPLDLCAVIGRRFEHDGVLQRGDSYSVLSVLDLDQLCMSEGSK